MASRNLLIVDTNIISHALMANQIDCYIELFKNLEQDFYFGVTEFTRYELMRSSDKSHREDIEEYIKQNMYTVDLSDVLMKFAARVFYFYSKHPHTKGLAITDGDIINAALVIAKDCYILTIDNNDYPREFFSEVSRHRMTYISKASKKETVDVVYLLKPDIVQIQSRFEEYSV